MLQDGECLPLISALKEQQVPIVIYSGWLLPDADMPPEISGLSWPSKPMDCNSLVRVVAEAAPQIVDPETIEQISFTAGSPDADAH